MTYPFLNRRRGSGDEIARGQAGEALGDRKVVYRDVNGLWRLADADTAATMPTLGFTVGAIASGNFGRILLQGMVGLAGWTWTRGAELYASTTAGEITHTVPVWPNVIQIIGVAYDTDIIYFNPAPSSGGAHWGEEDVFYRYTDPNTNIGTHAAGRLTDGVDVLMRMDFYLPSDFDLTTWGADAIVVAGGTANLRWGITTNWGAVCTESYVASNDAIAVAQTAVVQNILTCLDITSGLTGAAARDLIGLEFTRYASNVLDTVNADCYFLGVLLRRP